jgi:1-acyl-sn-glycerol-3-phosphate acyltransferase
MITFLRYLYLFWLTSWFVGGFLLLYPIFWLLIQNKKWHKYYFPISKVWAYFFYWVIGVPVKTRFEFKPTPNQVYVYCPNHFSVMDIHLLTRAMPAYFSFVGLHDLLKVPLFGYFYRNFHITVNRQSLRDRYNTYLKCKEAIQNGKNLVIFPEGGIWTTDFPQLSEFKEGPFRIAIELQIPIVPVTIPYNWKMLPVYDFKRLAWHRQEVIFHQPIETKGMNVKEIEKLMAQTYQVIDKELKSKFNQ